MCCGCAAGRSVVTPPDRRPVRKRLRRLVVVLGALVVAACGTDNDAPIDPRNATQVARGSELYERHCASCHGRGLEGQPAWRARLPNGRMPAPPHDDSGHTWHHPDAALVGITKFGLAPPYAPPGYASDMPAFGSVLTDAQIRDVLAYIKSRWSPRAREAQAQITRDAGKR
jgi:mono/diheme cytochrome c family protein